MVICQLDKTEHASWEALNKHLLRMRYKQGDYHHEFNKRVDLLTGEIIPYKNLEQYLGQDFIDKKNLKKWMKEKPVEGRVWAVEWLKKRKAEKNLIFAPGHLELKSLVAPSLVEFEAMGGYEEICKEAGLVYRYSTKALVPKLITGVICDSREQNPLKIDGVTITTAALKVGDYGLPEPYDQGVYIERKSLQDFIGTLAQGLARFTRELERAKQAGHYVVMVVEENLNQAFSFNYLPYIARHVRAQPSFIFKNLRDLLALYPDTFQCVFVDGRVESARLVKVILGSGHTVKTADLQYLYSEKLL